MLLALTLVTLISYNRIRKDYWLQREREDDAVERDRDAHASQLWRHRRRWA